MLLSHTYQTLHVDHCSDFRDGSTLPTWIGELYLEYHRGTYTSHGSIKRNNRKCEILLKELEYLSTLASIQAASSNSNYRYPKVSFHSRKFCLDLFAHLNTLNTGRDRSTVGEIAALPVPRRPPRIGPRHGELIAYLVIAYLVQLVS